MGTLVDKKFRSALQEAVNRAGTQKELAQKTNIPESNIGKYLSGQIKVIQERTLSKLLPFLDIEIESGYTLEPNPTHKSRHAKLLLELFEKLDRDNQLSVLSFTEDVLTEQERKWVPFTEQELTQLADKGITFQRGLEFVFSTKGLCWLYNVLVVGKSVGKMLSNELFKKLLTVNPDPKMCREMRIKILQVDVYDGKMYDQLTIYMNGSPPRYYTPFICINSVSKMFTWKKDENSPFLLDDDSIYDLLFTEQEYAALRAGETLKIPYQG